MPRNRYNKFDVLERLFMEKTNNGTARIGEDIDFTLSEVGIGILATGGTAPVSWSNFVLDLTRKNKPIMQRLPQSVINFGYDLRKKTGVVPDQANEKYCGTFVYRGKDENGNTIPIQDWLVWGEPTRTVTVENRVPELVKQFISNDEASLFSVIDYCDILSNVLDRTVYRVQSPMKWQPNEIDGYYVAQIGRSVFVYPVEAKAISTDDDINIVQMYGQYKTFVQKYTRNDFTLAVRPIAAKMEQTGMLLAVLECNAFYDPQHNRESQMFIIHDVVRVVLDTPLSAWQ